MADNTHGPVFTLKEVGLVVEEVVRESGALGSPQALALLTGQVVGKLNRAGVLTFPANEPVYVLPAIELSAMVGDAIDIYSADLGAVLESDPRHVEARAAACAFALARLAVPDTEEGS